MSTDKVECTPRSECVVDQALLKLDHLAYWYDVELFIKLINSIMIWAYDDL